MNNIPPAIALSSGGYFDYTQPDANQIRITDIARGLSNMPRFNGQTKSFYSVAQHCVLCSRYAPEKMALEALLHDAHEAFVLDVPTPFKQLLPDYREIEARCHQAVAKQFSVPYPLSDYVKVIDLRMLATERRDLLPASTSEEDLCYWEHLNEIEPYEDHIQPWLPFEAYMNFLDRFNFLTR